MSIFLNVVLFNKLIKFWKHDEFINKIKSRNILNIYFFHFIINLSVLIVIFLYHIWYHIIL